MRSKYLIAVSAAVGLCLVPARADEIPKEALKVLNGAKQFELYSLDPNEDERVKDGFHEWKILGKLIVTEADVRKKLGEALTDGIKNAPERGRKCFNPRHGIRVVADSKTFDFVICYECRWVQIYSGNKHIKTCLTASEQQGVLDKVLKDAKVPLPKPARHQ